MTCIVGIVDNNTATLAGDSAGVSGTVTQPRADAKVFANGPFVIGFTTSFRMGQILRYGLTLPEPPADHLHRFMCTAFVDAVRGALKDAGWATKNNEQESGGCFLVGVKGHLFEVDNDYQVGEMGDGYTAVGCGAEVALGALHATIGSGLSAFSRATLALEAAAHFSTGVRAPFVAISCDGHGHGTVNELDLAEVNERDLTAMSPHEFRDAFPYGGAE